MRRAAALLAILSAFVAFAPSARASHTPRGAGTGLAWASFGDSYAAGEGLPDPTKIHDDPTVQNCQRALAEDGNRSTAWGAQVAATRADKDHYAFVACTGAITDDLFPNPAGRLQAGQLDQARFFAKADRFDAVTFSFGGNNVGFVDILLSCAGIDPAGGVNLVAGGVTTWALAPWVGCNLSEEEMKARVERLTDTSTVGPRVDCANLGDASSGTGIWDSDDLASGKVTVPELYDVIGRCVVKPGGVVVVMGYPQLVEEADRWPTLEGNRCQRIRRADVGKLRAANARFNERLLQAAEYADRTTPAQFVFVDPNQFWEGEAFNLAAPSASDLNTPSKRHALCGGGEDWLNGITIGTDGDGVFRKERSFHPKQLGHDAMARAAGTVSFELKPPTPLTEGEILNFALPATVCSGLEIPEPIQLTDGGFDDGGDNYIAIRDPSIGDLDSDGIADAAAPLICGNGIADHFTEVLLVFAADRTALTATIPEAPNLADIADARITDGKLTVDMAWAVGEPLCCPSTYATGVYTWNGVGLVQQSIQVLDDDARSRRLVDALNSGDRTASARLIEDNWESYFYERSGPWRSEGCERPVFDAPNYCRLMSGQGESLILWVDLEGQDDKVARVITAGGA